MKYKLITAAITTLSLFSLVYITALLVHINTEHYTNLLAR